MSINLIVQLKMDSEFVTALFECVNKLTDIDIIDATVKLKRIGYKSTDEIVEFTTQQTILGNIIFICDVKLDKQNQQATTFLVAGKDELSIIQSLCNLIFKLQKEKQTKETIES